MERAARGDKTVYSANRWLVGILVLAAGGIGALLLQPWLLTYLRVTNFRARGLTLLGYVPPDIRVLVIQVIALVVIAAGLVLVRFLVDPRMVTVDETGIEVRRYFGMSRGRWRDFIGMRPAGFRGMKTIQFAFRKAPGFHTALSLPKPPLAVDNRAVVAMIAEWIMESKTAVPAGFLDKYDPKKLHAAAAAAAAAPMPVTSAASPARRSFGKRTA